MAEPTTRRLKIALMLSLGVNLVILGMVGGALLHRWRDGPPEMTRDPGFGPFTEALDPEDRAALRRAFAREDGGNPLLFRREMRGELEAFLVLLRAEPLDETALAEQLGRMTAGAQARLQTAERLLLARFAEMSPEARQRFADRMEEILSHRQMRDGHRRKSDD